LYIPSEGEAKNIRVQELTRLSAVYTCFLNTVYSMYVWKINIYQKTWVNKIMFLCNGTVFGAQEKTNWKTKDPNVLNWMNAYSRQNIPFFSLCYVVFYASGNFL
jgi:hypothetical protein